MAGIISQLERDTEKVGEMENREQGEVTRAQLLREAECPVCLQEMVSCITRQSVLGSSFC